MIPETFWDHRIFRNTYLYPSFAPFMRKSTNASSHGKMTSNGNRRFRAVIKHMLKKSYALTLSSGAPYAVVALIYVVYSISDRKDSTQFPRIYFFSLVYYSSQTYKTATLQPYNIIFHALILNDFLLFATSFIPTFCSSQIKCPAFQPNKTST